MLLFGGGGTLTADDNANIFWFAADGAVNDSVEASLRKRNYNIRRYFGKMADADEAMKILVQQLQQTKCSKALQLVHFLKSDPSNLNVVSTFAFSASVIHLSQSKNQSNGMTTYTVVEDYTKDYAYPLTEETLKTLSVKGVGAQIVADIDAAGVLVDMKADSPNQQ